MMLSTKNPLCNRRGMSLIELVVVIAIVGIIAAIGIPEYGRFVAKNSVHRLTNDLLQNIRLAKTIAVKESREYLIVFDQANNRYLIGFDGSDPEDGDLLDVAEDGFGICGTADNGAGAAVEGDGKIQDLERIPVNDVDGDDDGIPDCIRVVNLSDYGSDVVFGYEATGSTIPPSTPPDDPNATPPDDGVVFPLAAAADTAVFNSDGSVDRLGYIYFQHLAKGYSFSVTMTSFAGGTNVWRWDGDNSSSDRTGITTWTEVR